MVQKKTQVKIFFERHGLPLLEIKRKEMEKADIVVAESVPDCFDKFMEAKTKEEAKEIAEQHPWIEDPEVFYEESKLLLDVMEKVEAVAVVTGQHRAVQELEEKDSEALKTGKRGRVKPKHEAKWLKTRDKHRAEALYKDILKKTEYQGKKIYIQAGAMHTSLYDELKKKTHGDVEIELQKVFLQKKELSKRTSIPEEEIDTEDQFTPPEKLTRMYMFKEETMEDAEKLSELREKRKNLERYFKDKYSSKWKGKLKEAEESEKKAIKLWEENEEYTNQFKKLKKELIGQGISPLEASGEAQLRILSEKLKNESIK